MDKLTQIEAFVDVADNGSLARAARKQRVTPVMLGRRIDALEHRLGVKLMHRTTRQLTLTEQGAIYLDHCRKLLGDLASADNLISAGRHTVSGHLSVSAPAAFGRLHVAAHASALLAASPELSLSFNLTDQLIDLVREGNDVGIRIGGVIDPSFVAVRLASNRRVVCGTPEYLQHHGTPRTLDDLDRHNCLGFSLQGGQQGGWHFQKHGKPVALKIRGNLNCNDGESLHRWASEGLGLAWRSTWEIAADLESGRLVTVLDDYALPGYDVMAIYLQQRHVPAKVRFLIEELKAIYARPGYWTGGYNPAL